MRKIQEQQQQKTGKQPQALRLLTTRLQALRLMWHVRSFLTVVPALQSLRINIQGSELALEIITQVQQRPELPMVVVLVLRISSANYNSVCVHAGVCVCVCVYVCVHVQVCVCVCVCCFVGVDGCRPLTMLVDVCQCCRLLTFICLPFFETLSLL